MPNFKLEGNADKQVPVNSQSGLNIAPQVGHILPFAGTVAPSGWAICDGLNGTPDLRGYFLIGATSQANAGQLYGTATTSHSILANGAYSFAFPQTTSVNHDGMNNSTSSNGDIGHNHNWNAVYYGSQAAGSNLLANSTASGGPIAFNNRPHSHNGGGYAGSTAANLNANHTHNTDGAWYNTSSNHTGTDHSTANVPTGNATSTSYSHYSPFIIMNYIVKV